MFKINENGIRMHTIKMALHYSLMKMVPQNRSMKIVPRYTSIRMVPQNTSMKIVPREPWKSIDENGGTLHVNENGATGHVNENSSIDNNTMVLIRKNDPMYTSLKMGLWYASNKRQQKKRSIRLTCQYTSLKMAHPAHINLNVPMSRRTMLRYTSINGVRYTSI